MNLDVLSNFLTICDSGSINKAAQLLHISQPPLTKQIQNLEKELNAKLFERNNSGITLTEEGKILYERASSLIAYKELIKNEIEHCVHVIRFGMTTSSVKYATRVLKGYSKKHNINFEIHEKNTYELIDQLNNDLIEFAFIRTPFEPDPAQTMIRLTDDHIVLVANEEFFSGINDEAIPLSWLIDKPLIANRRWKNYLVLEKDGKKTMPTYKYLCDDNRTAQTMANEGLGIAILPSSELTELKKGMLSKVVENNKYQTSIYLVYKTNKALDNNTKDLLNYIIKEKDYA